MSARCRSDRSSRLFFAAALVAALGVTSGVAGGRAAAAQEAAPSATVPPHPENFYRAGARVDVTTPKDGDVVVAGRIVDIAQTVGGDILAAGWDVTLSGAARDDVRIAGGTVTVNAPVAGDLTLAGGDVTLGTGTRVDGRAWITGDTIRVNGDFARDLAIAARSVQIDGHVRGPVHVVAEELRVLPGARVDGRFTYRGRAMATVEPGATLAQPIRFESIDAAEARRARAWPGVSTLLFSLHLLAVGLLVLYFVPRFEPATVATLRRRPGRSLLLGLALLAAVPAAAAGLVLSVLGFPLGVALGMFYLMALFAALLVTAFFLGDLEARLLRAGPLTTRGQHALLLVAGVLTLAVLRLALGGVAVLVAMLFGLGALSMAAYDRYVNGPAASEVPA